MVPVNTVTVQNEPLVARDRFGLGQTAYGRMYSLILARSTGSTRHLRLNLVGEPSVERWQNLVGLANEIGQH